MIGKTFSILFHSIVTTDLFIFIAALITVFVLVAVGFFSKQIKKNMKSGELVNNTFFTISLYTWLKVAYTIFLTLISIFPLLGMLGTVSGLLGLDLAAGDMENIKNNFFMALTSTAWGIIFAITFKLINALITDVIEARLEDAVKLMEKQN